MKISCNHFHEIFRENDLLKRVFSFKKRALIDSLKQCHEIFTVHDLFLEIVITFVIIMNLNLQRIRF